MTQQGSLDTGRHIIFIIEMVRQQAISESLCTYSAVFAERTMVAVALQEDLCDGPSEAREHGRAHDHQKTDQIELCLPRHQQQQA